MLLPLWLSTMTSAFRSTKSLATSPRPAPHAFKSAASRLELSVSRSADLSKSFFDEVPVGVTQGGAVASEMQSRVADRPRRLLLAGSRGLSVGGERVHLVRQGHGSVERSPGERDAVACVVERGPPPIVDGELVGEAPEVAPPTAPPGVQRAPSSWRRLLLAERACLAPNFVRGREMKQTFLPHDRCSWSLPLAVSQCGALGTGWAAVLSKRPRASAPSPPAEPCARGWQHARKRARTVSACACQAPC